MNLDPTRAYPKLCEPSHKFRGSGPGSITEGGSWAGEGGRQVHASQTDHPEHESAASTTRLATSATPSAHELRRTNLRKRTGVRTGGGNQGGQE